MAITPTFAGIVLGPAACVAKDADARPLARAVVGVALDADGAAVAGHAVVAPAVHAVALRGGTPRRRSE